MVPTSFDVATVLHKRPQQRPPHAQPRDAFAELCRVVVGSQPLTQILTRVAEIATACIPGAHAISVILRDEENTSSSAASTGTLAVNLDEWQYATGVGPCLTAVETGQVVRIDDTRHEDTYRDFAAVAARAGVLSIVCVGMAMPERLTGSVDVYTSDPTPLDEGAVQLLQTFAAHAATALTNHSRYAAALAQSAQLLEAMQSRAVIEQAKGILSVDLRCTPEEAFAHLSKRSQNTNYKLRDLAADVVAKVVADARS